MHDDIHAYYDKLHEKYLDNDQDNLEKEINVKIRKPVTYIGREQLPTDIERRELETKALNLRHRNCPLWQEMVNEDRQVRAEALGYLRGEKLEIERIEDEEFPGEPRTKFL